MQDVKKQVIITSIWLKQVSVYALFKLYAQTPQDLPQVDLRLGNRLATTLRARKTKAREVFPTAKPKDWKYITKKGQKFYWKMFLESL